MRRRFADGGAHDVQSHRHATNMQDYSHFFQSCSNHNDPLELRDELSVGVRETAVLLPSTLAVSALHAFEEVEAPLGLGFDLGWRIDL